jgi:[acyl-carrier-protein] S-malonyltransferase
MIALLCSGQGAQHREMFRLSGEAAGASRIFAAAAPFLGVDPRNFVRVATDSAMYANRAAQILCVTQALAARAVLADIIPVRHIVAGYSVGEVAAWGVAGLLSADQAISLASVRAEIMSRASGAGDGLASVRGLLYDTVARLAHETQAEIAIVNPNDVFVVGGSEAAVRNFCEAALAAGALRAAPIRVGVASHTSRLAAAVAPFRAAIAAHHPANPPAGVVLLSALDGSAVCEAVSGAEDLARQISTSLHWSACLHAAVERGAGLFVELGPGRALAEMAHAAHPDIPARSFDDFRSADGLRSWIRRSLP